MGLLARTTTVAVAVFLASQCNLTVDKVRKPGISRLDAFVANLGVNQVYLNDGYGNFTVQNLETDAEGESSYGVALGDLNGDGHLDAFVANFGVNHVYLNNGGGTFERYDVTTDDHKSCGVALADLNGDGHLDAFVVNGWHTWNEVNRVYINNGDGTFEGHDANDDAHRSCAVALGNLSGSKNPDALVVNWFPPCVRLYRNMGFLPGVDPFDGESLDTPLLYGYMSSAVALADMNWDGMTDVVVGSWKSGTSLIGDLLYLSDGSELDYETVTGDNWDTTGIALGDLDGDLDLDVFTVHWNTPHRVYLNKVYPTGHGPLTCEFTAYEVSTMNDTYGGYGVALGDLDGDCDLDAFVANNTINRIYLNAGLGKSFEGRDASTDPSEGFWSSRAVALGDLDGK